MGTQSYLKEKLAANALVYVDGRKVKFYTLELKQAFGQHHTFCIRMDYDSMDSKFMNNPLDQMNLVGKFVDIELQQGDDNANAYEFKGVIADVSNEGQDGKHGYLVLEGFSMTVLLERGKRADVFCRMSLQEVFKEVTDGIINKSLSCVNSPVYTGVIDFLMQYEESDWQFLQRLSAISGETLFYTGRDLVFGQYKDWKPTEVTYDKEIISFRTGARLVANNFSAYQYLPATHDLLTQDAPERIDAANDFVNTAAMRSKELTEKRPVRNLIPLSVEDKGSFDELVKRRKVTTASQTVYITGTAKTCAPRIGRLLTIRMPENIPGASNPGTFRITKVEHYIDQAGRYRCEFEGIPSALKFFPVPELKMPVIGPMVGEVVQNDDPDGQGRVCVEFPFATDRISETWMRVMSPSAGASDTVDKNRGMVFVPEKGDQVMVGFENNDPNRPYVTGSLFHGNNTFGGQADNHIKSIITRSGHTLEFDDSKESLGITLKDKNGNLLHIDSAGNNMEIIALETMTLKAKNIILQAEENITGEAGKDMEIQVGENLTNNVGGDITTTSANNTQEVSEASNITIGTKLDIISGETKFVAESGDFTVQCSGVALIQGAEDARISKA